MKIECVGAIEGNKGEQFLWKTEDNKFLITSKVKNEYVHETYIFSAGANGEITDWSELNGSSRGEVSHQEVLERAGYEVE